MLERIILSIFIGVSLWLILTGFFPRVSPKAEKAVLSRKGKKTNLTVSLINIIAVKILRFISLEDSNRENLQQTLSVLGYMETPELFHARAWGTGILYFLGFTLISPLLSLIVWISVPDVISPATVFQFSLIIAVVLLFVGRHAVLSELTEEMQKRREEIEWELSLFSGTVLQQLKYTRNVTEILESYQKIAGKALYNEIERTLNDMRTGNHEQALKNLAGRVNSGSFTHLTQGLTGLLRGDDQTSYFQIITKDFSKNQSELIKKELLTRPSKLTINNVLLLVGMLSMFMVAIGSYLMDSSAGLF